MLLLLLLLKVNIGASRVPTCRISQDFDKWRPDIGFPFVFLQSTIHGGGEGAMAHTTPL